MPPSIDAYLAANDLHARLSALTEDVDKTSEIAGEQLNALSVRSSIARRIGVDIGALAPVDRHVEGVVEMVLGATANCIAPLTRDRPKHTLDAVLTKTRFWQRWTAPGSAALNERQAKLVNRLLDGFERKLTSSKWAAIAKCSPDTALRDITDLLARGVLRKSDAGGRSTSYELNNGSK